MKIKTLLLATLAVTMFGTTLLASGHPEVVKIMKRAKGVVDAITPKELAKKLSDGEEIIMLDVRESYMREEGDIDADDIIAIGRGVLEFEVLNQIKDKKANIVVYCRTGKGAPLAAYTLKKDLGYENVSYLKGGIEGWMNAGYPIYNHFGEVKLAH